MTKVEQKNILTPAVRRIMDALRDADGEARVVGGAVRDVVMQRDIGDIDLAANLPPERVMEILAQHHIKTVPTGLAHGTITAVIDHIGYEITTLRRDVATDGRHAEVAFTNDWQEDAARRDFTFNALYVDDDGTIYDYFGGVDDAAKGHVKFIGDASARVREDVLRILRFFRFFAWFGRGAADETAIAACRELARLMPRLSAERVAREVLKLLGAPNPLPAWRLMIDNNITAHFLVEATDTARMENLLQAEQQHHENPVPLLRLAALLPQDKAVAETIATRLKLSNKDSEQLCAFVTLPALLCDNLDPMPLRRILYQHGADNCGTALLLTGKNIDVARATIAAWGNPLFPIKGEDIIKLGIPAGTRVGEILREVEKWWIDGDFRADRNACLGQAKQYGKIH